MLAHAKELDIWHKHWGNAAFTIKIPDERSPQGVKNKYLPNGLDTQTGAAEHGGGLDQWHDQH